MKPIAIFFHCCFFLGEPPVIRPRAVSIINEQMNQLAGSGLMKSASLFFAGVNGGAESRPLVAKHLPSNAYVNYFGLQSKNENSTIYGLHEWCKVNLGWNVLYLHCKGASSQPGTAKAANADQWRTTMMTDLVTKWRQCVEDLDAGHDIVCSHWKWNMADGTQHIAAGNFAWLKSDFVAKLPSIMLRERIKQDGIGALSSRFEAEVFFGNGPRPSVKMFRQLPGDGIP